MQRGDLEQAASGAAVVIFLGAVASLILRLMTGCAPAVSPRAEARSVVVTVAEAVHVADEACASLVIAREDASLGHACAKAVDEARTSLLVAEEALDATDDAAEDKLPCALQHAASVLQGLLGIINEHGGKTPPAVEDALQLAPLIAGACHA